ncbi:glycosyl hydrolases family 31-domain-containing protein [Aspergillus venezuelensis]
MLFKASMLLLLGAAASVYAAQESSSYRLNDISASPYAFTITNTADKTTIVSNTGILTGATNTSMTASPKNSQDTKITTRFITPSILHVHTDSTISSGIRFTGAQFSTNPNANHYGVWSYPFNHSIINAEIAFDLKGLQGNDGINYASARAPYFISSTGYAVYADTQAMGSYSFSNERQMVEFRFNATELDYYIILPEVNGEAEAEAQPDFKSLLTQYASLTDTSPLWSPRAYGPMFWHNDFQRESAFPEGVSNAQEFVGDVVDKLAANRVRASAVMVDRPYGTGDEGWGNYDFDPEYWPDVKGLVSDVAKKGLDFQTWVANRAVPGSELFNTSASNGWLFPDIQNELQPGVALNLSIPAAYTYLQDAMKFLPDLGIKGYKIDRGDENEMPIWEENVQTYLFHKLMYQSQAAHWDGAGANRPTGFYNFARSVNDRSRRYTGVWGADPAGNENGLLQSIRQGIRSGLLGFPMWGSDCGGYTRRVGTGTPAKELWARWMWFSAFSPVYELMLYEESIPWYDYSADLMAVLRETTQVHHELIPFIQSYMFRATNDGLPVIRALFLEAPSDEGVWDADESYFFGEEFLVAPITRNNGEKSVYFPKGSKYLEYFGKHDVYEGGSEEMFKLDINSVPVFVREGAIVPRGDLYQSNNQWDRDWTPWLDIEVYPSYNVESSKFQYFDEKNGRSVDIWMETNKRKKTLCISYGALGTPGELQIYVKGGPQKFKLASRGGNECVRNVDLLFD